VIAATSVVNRDLSPYSVAAGVPAKVVKSIEPGLSRPGNTRGPALGAGPLAWRYWRLVLTASYGV